MALQDLIVVVGAGVIGLSTALKLQREGYKVAIVAECLPGDPNNIKYTSCWAGAHHVSVAGPNDLQMHKFDMETFIEMRQMLEDDPNAPMMMRPQLEYREFERNLVHGVDQLTLLSRYQPNFRMLEPSELPAGITHGAAFDTLMINTPDYMPYLLGIFKAGGGEVSRCTLETLADAVAAHPEPKARPETAKLIKERGIALCPELLPVDKRAAMRIEDLDVVEDAVGLRPTRTGGIRIEMDLIEVAGKRVPVLHHYGSVLLHFIIGSDKLLTYSLTRHGGFGYQTSWGSAGAAVKLLRCSLGTRD
ncbi:hypothetical protein RQP46_009490 [Phenoliferia psychrophenolica]